LRLNLHLPAAESLLFIEPVFVNNLEPF
jgi:hypothetical protein